MKLVEIGPDPYRGREKGYFVQCYAEMISEETEFVTIGPFRKGQDEDDLENLLKTLTLMGELFPAELMFIDDYMNVPGFLGWFNTGYTTEENLYAQFPDLRISFEDYKKVADRAARYNAVWPFDPDTEYENPARYNGYQVFYVDGDGKRTRMDVEL